jgi:hypothetical protein
MDLRSSTTICWYFGFSGLLKPRLHGQMQQYRKPVSTGLIICGMQLGIHTGVVKI